MVAAQPRFARWLDEAERLDVAIYAAIAGTPTPTIDRAMRRLSSVADYSRLSLASATVLAVAGGRRGRRAAVTGLASVAVAAAVTNAVAKPLGRRRRPERSARRITARYLPGRGDRPSARGQTLKASRQPRPGWSLTPRKARRASRRRDVRIRG
jgi:hypothetical protein